MSELTPPTGIADVDDDSEAPASSSNPETNRDKVLRGEAVRLNDDRLREMQRQAIAHEGVAPLRTLHWHWAAMVNELIALRSADETTERSTGWLHAVQYDKVGWLCSVCGGWNHPSDLHCTHTHAVTSSEKASAPSSILPEWNAAVEHAKATGTELPNDPQ